METDKDASWMLSMPMSPVTILAADGKVGGVNDVLDDDARADVDETSDQC